MFFRFELALSQMAELLLIYMRTYFLTPAIAHAPDSSVTRTRALTSFASRTCEFNAENLPKYTRGNSPAMQRDTALPTYPLCGAVYQNTRLSSFFDFCQENKGPAEEKTFRVLFYRQNPPFLPPISTYKCTPVL